MLKFSIPLVISILFVGTFTGNAYAGIGFDPPTTPPGVLFGLFETTRVYSGMGGGNPPTTNSDNMIQDGLFETIRVYSGMGIDNPPTNPGNVIQDDPSKTNTSAGPVIQGNPFKTTHLLAGDVAPNQKWQ